MKKYIIYISVFFLLLPILSAEADECSQSCKISDAPAPALTEYLSNLSAVRSNILKSLSQTQSALNISGNTNSASSQFSSGVKKAKNKTSQAFTELLSFKDYFVSFDYDLVIPLTNVIPAEVKRDYDKIDAETQRFIQILERSSKRGTSDAIVENICEGVSNCQIPQNITAQDALLMIIKNNRRITQLYEASIIDKGFLATNRSFILTSPDFESQMETYYNKDTLGSCSKCEGGFWSNAEKQIQGISIKNAEYDKGKKEWIDAWSLGGSIFTGGREADESRVLTEYLETQGISDSQAAVILGNLNRYNSGATLSDNPLFRSATYSHASVKNEYNTFNETIQDQFSVDGKVGIVALTKVNAKIKESQDIKNEIAAIYQDQLPFSQGQDTGAQGLQLRIINMHFSLIRSINILEKNKKSVEKLCDKQATGRGKCSY